MCVHHCQKGTVCFEPHWWSSKPFRVHLVDAQRGLRLLAKDGRQHFHEVIPGVWCNMFRWMGRFALLTMVYKLNLHRIIFCNLMQCPSGHIKSWQTIPVYWIMENWKNHLEKCNVVCIMDFYGQLPSTQLFYSFYHHLSNLLVAFIMCMSLLTKLNQYGLHMIGRWLIGQWHGGRLYKKNFANAVYEKLTGHSLPSSSNPHKNDVQLFKVFRANLWTMIRSHNYLLNLYQKVNITFHDASFINIIVSLGLSFC